MEIITHILKKFITNNLQIFSNEFIEEVSRASRYAHNHSLNTGNLDINEFLVSLSELNTLSNIQLIKLALETMDLDYFNSKERKENFMSKGRFSRTVQFLFGEVTITRYYYVNKHTKKDPFYHIDRILGLDKYLHLTPSVQNKLLYLVSDYSSYAKAGRILGEFINKNVPIPSKFKCISRATVFNYVKKVNLEYNFEKRHRKVNNIYIELDEHYIPIQKPKKSKERVRRKMVKLAKVYSHKDDKGNYLDRFVIADNLKDNFQSVLYDYVCSEYDLDYVKNIYILGDGANWIKSCKNLFSRKKSVFLLDKFHAFQAVSRLVTSKNKDAYNFVCSFIYNNDLKTFKIWYTLFYNESEKHRLNVLEANYKYLCNQWAAIQRIINSSASCSMEGCISSTLAASLSSRPKGFSIHSLSNRLMLCMFFRNSFGCEDTFYRFTKLNEKSTSLDNLDFSIFDMFHKGSTYKFNLNCNMFKPAFYH